MNITVGMGPRLLFALICLKSLLPAAFYQCKEYFVDVLIPLCLLLFCIYQKLYLLLVLFHQTTAYKLLYKLQIIYKRIVQRACK